MKKFLISLSLLISNSVFARVDVPPSFMKKFLLGKSAHEAASILGGLMLDKNCKAQDIDKYKQEYGSLDVKCMMSNSKKKNSVVMRSFIVVDGVIKNGIYNFVDTSLNQKNFKSRLKISSFIRNDQPTYIEKINSSERVSDQQYFTVWEWGDGYFSSNVICQKVQLGGAWVLPQKIRDCRVINFRYGVKQKSKNLFEHRKYDAQY